MRRTRRREQFLVPRCLLVRALVRELLRGQPRKRLRRGVRELLRKLPRPVLRRSTRRLLNTLLRRLLH